MEGIEPIASPEHPGRAPADWVQTALAGIGAATIVTDALGRVLFMNPVAESLTGWPQGEGAGQGLTAVFRVESEQTRRPVTDPVTEVLATGKAVGLADHTVLIARDGTERRLDHGAAPVRDAAGAVVGAVLVFCDVSERQRAVRAVEDARAFAEGIVQTVREPLVVLDADLRVWTANRSFYQTFRVDPAETEGRFLFDLGNRQWDIPRLRELLEEVLPRDSHFGDFEVDHTFEGIGRRAMVLNARRLDPAGGRPGLILLAIEDATDRRRAAGVLALSETRYRRLFETAQDGILLVDPDTRRVFDANPFLTDLLGYTRDELVGKELWEIGLFRDIESSKAAFRTLQEKGYIRYDDLPLRTHDGRGIEVEFVSNVYPVGDTRVIQCNIRDVTDRKRAEDALRAARAGLEGRVRERTAELAHSNGALTDEIARRERAEADRRDLQQRLTTAQEDERRRIARELHDQMGQHLAALGLGLEVIKSETPDPSPTRDRLQQLQALTDLIGREVHDLALELRPTALDDLGLQAALANYAEGWAERSAVEVDFHAAGLDGDRLPVPVETALYRVVQEALTNVLKHASARRVSVVLQRSPGHVSAVVEDDGRGFDPESAPAAGHRLGVLGMRERVALVGGSLAVESAPGRGATVIARVPLPAGDGEDRDG
ncbi:MAG: sensor protein [Gemmataceae bacterium]|nr:sensor protein [Gemmataceae bacterium]